MFVVCYHEFSDVSLCVSIAGKARSRLDGLLPFFQWYGGVLIFKLHLQSIDLELCLVSVRVMSDLKSFKLKEILLLDVPYSFKGSVYHLLKENLMPFNRLL
jgi:hypothetical protein